MLKQPEVAQQEMELVTIESLVPSDHLLRKIDAAVDLEFIRHQCRTKSREPHPERRWDPLNSVTIQRPLLYQVTSVPTRKLYSRRACRH